MAYDYALGFGSTIRVRGYDMEDGYGVAFHYQGEYEQSALVGALKQHLDDDAPQGKEIVADEKQITVQYDNRERAVEHVQTILGRTQTLFLQERPSYDDPSFETALEQAVEGTPRTQR